MQLKTVFYSQNHFFSLLYGIPQVVKGWNKTLKDNHEATHCFGGINMDVVD